MLRFKQEIIIDKPLDQVIKLFIDRKYYRKWQPGLLSSEQVENYPHLKYRHRFDFGRRKMEVTETFLRVEIPGRIEIANVLKGVKNLTYNSFASAGPQTTKWTCFSEFHFSGIMKLVSIFMKDGLRRQSEIIMSNFKKYVESQ